MHTIGGSWSGLANPALRYNDPESSTAGSIAANPALATATIPSWFGRNHIRVQELKDAHPPCELGVKNLMPNLDLRFFSWAVASCGSARATSCELPLASFPRQFGRQMVPPWIVSGWVPRLQFVLRVPFSSIFGRLGSNKVGTPKSAKNWAVGNLEVK